MTMLIHYFSSSTIPSSEANSVQVMQMCEAFVANGHEVTLFAYDSGSNKVPKSEIFETYGVTRTFNLVLLRRRIRPEWGATYLYGLIFAFLSFTKKPDAIYGRNLPAIATATLMGKRTSFEAHMPPLKPWSRLITYVVTRRRNYVGTVVISEALKRYFLEKLNSSAPVMVLASGAQHLDFQRSEDTHILRQRPVVGYAGSFYSGRGLDVITKMCDRAPWADFRLAGGSIEMFRQQTDVYDLPPNLFIIGRINPAEVREFIEECDVLIAPYQTQIAVSGGGDTSDYFSPLKVFEYMRSGKPIVASDLPTIREVLSDEISALLCPPDDIEAWCVALERMVKQPEFARTLGKNSRNAFIAHFSMDVRAKKVASTLFPN